MDHCNCTAITSAYNFLSTSLVMYFDALKFCHCDAQLQNECSEETFQISNFHSLIYDKFCNPEHFQKLCNSSSNSDTNLLLDQQCQQLAQYKRGILYDEWFVGWSPFCKTYGFGTSLDVYINDPSVSVPYRNMPPSCQGTTVVAILIFYILSILIIFANITVLLVIKYDQYFRTPYGYFKASIAFADLCIGLIVIPLIIYHFHEDTFGPRTFQYPGEFSNPLKHPNQLFFGVAGFFAIFSLSISVYSLTASSLDRYLSISRPFLYNAKKLFTSRRTLVIILGIWILSAIYGIFPFTNSSTSYGMVSATFILAGPRPLTRDRDTSFDWIGIFNATNVSVHNHAEYVKNSTSDFENNTKIDSKSNESEEFSSEAALYLILSLYLLSLIIPLIILWTVNICTVKAYKTSQKKRTKENRSSIKKQEVSLPTANEPNNQSNLIVPTIFLSGSVTSLQTSISEEPNKQLEDNPTSTVEEAPKTMNFLTVSEIPVVRSSSLSTERRCSRNNSNLKSSSFKKILQFRKTSSKKNKDLSKKMQKVLLRMSISFTICLLPSIISLFVIILLAPYTDIYDTKMYSVKIKLYENVFCYISSVFLFANSFVNCIIYTVLGKRFRDVTKQIYSGKISKIPSSNLVRRVSNMTDLFRVKKNQKPKINVSPV